MRSEIRNARSELGWLPRLLQSHDSLFPSGGYAHSFGLEGLVQAGEVTGADGLKKFLQEQAIPVMEHLELPFVRLAYMAAQDAAPSPLNGERAGVRGETGRKRHPHSHPSPSIPLPVEGRGKAESRTREVLRRIPSCHELGCARADIARLVALDERYGAMKGTFELRQASSRIGAQRLQMWERLAPHPLLARLEEERLAGRFQAHAAVVFGAQAAVADLPSEAALVGYYYQNLAAVVSAATKLIRLGQIAGQTLLTECLAHASEVAARSRQIGESDIGWFQPVLDIASARHETAYTRIFIS